MASRTASEIVTRVQDAIGNRFEGTMGSRDIQDVILDSLNDVISDVAKRYDLNVLARNATISVTSSNYRYAVPTSDTDSNTIRIKNILKASILRSGDTIGWELKRLSQRRKDSLFSVQSTTTSGRPIYYMKFGSNLELSPWPDTTYTVYLRTTIWPDKITINQTHPLPEQWDSVLEAGTTADIFGRLQLVEDADRWLAIYEKKAKDLWQQECEEPDWEPSLQPDSYRGNLSADPANDPFVRRYP